MPTKDERYLDIVLDPIRVCANYKPKFGQGQGAGLSVDQFSDLYRGDTFYAGFGLDNPLMYAAHKAAGGMTSVYRQIGIGAERLFRAVLRDELGLGPDDVTWSYQVSMPNGRSRTLSLDGRIPVDAVTDPVKRGRVRDWIDGAAAQVGVDGSSLKGVVFEVRQGYKSKDSKRQNADIANGTKAYDIDHLPCAAVMSGQIDTDIVIRYRANRWCIITGAGDEGDPYTNTYAFMEQVVGYDLAGFLERNRDVIFGEVDQVLRALLSPED
mgnify:CR=1 FL=1